MSISYEFAKRSYWWFVDIKSASRLQTITWDNVDPDLCRNTVSLCYNVSNHAVSWYCIVFYCIVLLQLENLKSVYFTEKDIVSKGTEYYPKTRYLTMYKLLGYALAMALAQDGDKRNNNGVTIPGVRRQCNGSHWGDIGSTPVNTLKPEPNGRQFVSNILWISAKENFICRLNYYWTLFLRVWLIVLEFWFRQWLDAQEMTSICLKQCWLRCQTSYDVIRSR